MAKIKVTYNTLSVRQRKAGGVGGVGCLSLTSSPYTNCQGKLLLILECL